MATIRVVIIDGFGQIDIASFARLALLIEAIGIGGRQIRAGGVHDLSSNCCYPPIVERLSVTNKL